jgi:hypothetical protein
MGEAVGYVCRILDLIIPTRILREHVHTVMLAFVIVAVLAFSSTDTT